MKSKIDPGKLPKTKILEGIVGWTLIVADAALIIGALGYSIYQSVSEKMPEISDNIYKITSTFNDYLRNPI